MNMPIKRALVSVSDKRGIVALCRTLESLGIEIISTGGTMKLLRQEGVHVIAISQYTGSPEILDGRVKTLHPAVHAGLLFRRDIPAHVETMAQAKYDPIDLVVVNLYPFEQTVANPKATEEEIIENIDIGGPSMVRSAAKNFDAVAVVVNPDDYAELAAQLKANQGALTQDFRRNLAAKAFAEVAAYDNAIAAWFASSSHERFPPTLYSRYDKASGLRYGENPHQEAALYREAGYSGVSLVHAEILSGKELSYNNYNDLEACLEMLLDFDQPFACVVKHANPCGAAVGASIDEAYRLAYESDPLSAYGSIIGLNRPVDIASARLLHDTPFVECVIAPYYSDEALALLRKKSQRRLLALQGIDQTTPAPRFHFRMLRGGALAQSPDCTDLDEQALTYPTSRRPTPQEMGSLRFAWKVVKHTKSNAIVFAHGKATVGIGMGQTSRVDAADLAARRAGERARGGVMASDAFFPMPDGLEVGIRAGVTAVIQPGGSKGDPDVIAAAEKAGIAMVFTGVRHFKH